MSPDYDECSHTVTVTDNEPPTFTTAPIENCVDPLQSVVYTESDQIRMWAWNRTFKNPSPDYYTFESGNTTLDLTDLDDNCCDVSELTINWRIDFTDIPDPLNPASTISHGSISGTGQPSTYGSDILLWGDGVNFMEITHTITYWVEDCHGNVSEEKTEEIIVTPRPQIIKMNY